MADRTYGLGKFLRVFVPFFARLQRVEGTSPLFMRGRCVATGRSAGLPANSAPASAGRRKAAPQSAPRCARRPCPQCAVKNPRLCAGQRASCRAPCARCQRAAIQWGRGQIVHESFAGIYEFDGSRRAIYRMNSPLVLHKQTLLRGRSNFPRRLKRVPFFAAFSGIP